MWWLSCIISNVLLASLLALTAWFVQRRLGQPAVARLLWILVLVKLLTPPLVSVPWRVSSGTMACALGACGCEEHVRTQTLVRDTMAWGLLSVWTVGACVTGWTARRRWIRFQRLTAQAVPAPADWQALAAQLSAKLSLSRPPEILAVPGRLPPLVVAGWRRPRMLLPMDLLKRLEGSQREALLLHELAHLQRLDHLVRLLELTVSVAFWWLPFAGVIGRRLRDCEEACCDAAVLAYLPQARRDYACLLMDVIDFVNPVAQDAMPQATAMSAARDFECRLRSILDASPGTPGTWPAGPFATRSFKMGAFAVCLGFILLPCGVHYEFVARPAAAATSAEPEPTAGETCLPDIEREPTRTLTHCCPS